MGEWGNPQKSALLSISICERIFCNIELPSN